MNKTVAFYTLGCKVNTYETEAMRGMFEAFGYKTVDFKELADVYIVNTCTVTNIADRKSRQMLHQAKKRNPDGVIAAVGCYVQASEEALLADSAVDIVVGNNKKSDIVSVVENYLNNRDKSELVIDLNAQEEYETMNVITTMEKTRAFIKIQDGCNRFCSYCIIPYVRGRVRSREASDIITEITELARNGYKEFVLTGIHISSYGTDMITEEEKQAGKLPLADLIEAVSRIEGIQRIRLGSLEPRIITDEFAKRMAEIPQFCPHFHLSLQSGSNSVLKRMNRRYTAEEYYDKVVLLRKYFENPAFTTDIIVGFPQETEEEYQETRAFVEKVKFAGVHVFKYSKREGTKAADMPGQVAEDTKTKRSTDLISVTNSLEEEYIHSFMGKIEQVLAEERIMVEGTEYYIGHNERYQKLAFIADDQYENHIVECKVIDKLNEEILLCEIIH